MRWRWTLGSARRLEGKRACSPSPSRPLGSRRSFGSEDTSTLELSRRALGRLPASTELEIVTGAGHLFEEPGALEAVAALAGAWFGAHLGRRGHPAQGPLGSSDQRVRH